VVEDNIGRYVDDSRDGGSTHNPEKTPRPINWDMVFHAVTVTVTLISMVVGVAMWIRGNDLSNIDSRFKVVDVAIAKEARIAQDRDEMLRSERSIQVNNLDERLKRIEATQQEIMQILMKGRN
jgi:hypothetical protein